MPVATSDQIKRHPYDVFIRAVSSLSAYPICARWAILLPMLSVLLLSGCARGPYPLGPGFPQGNPWGTNPQMAQAPTQPSSQLQISELQRRVELLDKDNRQLQTQLAQSEQKSQVYRDELNLMRQQLADTVQRLETARLAAEQTQQQFQGLQASTRFRGGATLEANTNVRQIADALTASGIPTVFEQGAARIIVPADQLFQPGTAQTLPQATQILTPLASQLLRLAPRQRIGVEAFWDDQPIQGGAYTNPHQLTSALANAIAQLLTRDGGLPSNQLTTAGYGSTRPRQPNQTAAGRSANRRIEIVIYPDTL